MKFQLCFLFLTCSVLADTSVTVHPSISMKKDVSTQMVTAKLSKSARSSSMSATQTSSMSSSSTLSSSTSVSASTSMSVSPSTSMSVSPSTSMPVSPSMSTVAVSPSANHSSQTATASIQTTVVNTTTVMTTTFLPSTSSQIVPTTPVPKPTTTPKPDHDVEFDLNKNNNTCLRLKGYINVTVIYHQNDNVNKTANYTITLVKTPNITGVCSDLNHSSSSITLKWTDLLDFTVMFQGGDKKWHMDKINVTVHNKDRKHMNTSLETLSGTWKYNSSTNGNLYQAQKGHSYGCDPKNNLTLTNADSSRYTVMVFFEDLFIRPFNSSSSKTDKCPSTTDEPEGSSIVPIAVGCALAGLIVIVLIAYLIGRRKSNNRGYQQV